MNCIRTGPSSFPRSADILVPLVGDCWFVYWTGLIPLQAVTAPDRTGLGTVASKTVTVRCWVRCSRPPVPLFRAGPTGHACAVQADS